MTVQAIQFETLNRIRGRDNSTCTESQCIITQLLSRTAGIDGCTVKITSNTKEGKRIFRSGGKSHHNTVVFSERLEMRTVWYCERRNELLKHSMRQRRTREIRRYEGSLVCRRQTIQKCLHTTIVGHLGCHILTEGSTSRRTWQIQQE